MAIITKLEIQKNNKQKVNLYLDGVYYTRIYLDTCVKYGLKVGKEISEENLADIIDESEKLLAINFAINYAGSALKTAKQIKDYLRKKEFSSEIINHVITKMQEYKYIDDEQYVSAYVNTNGNKYGRNKIIMNLKQKGISEKIIENYFADNEEELVDKIENACLNIARKKARGMDLTDINNKQKLVRFLAGRGFDFDEIKHVINILEKGM